MNLTNLMKINKVYCLLMIMLVVFTNSCNNETKNKKHDSYKLKISTNVIRIPIDRNTYSESGCSFLFKSEYNKEYFVCQNKNSNEIHFYNLETKKLDFKIELNTKGPNGIKTNLRGFWVKNLNEIFITAASQYKLYKINKQGKILNVIDYYNYDEYSKNNLNKVMPFYSRPTTPLIIKDDYILLSMMPNGNWNKISEKDIKQMPISFFVNENKHTLKSLQVSYPISSYKYNNWMYSMTAGNNCFVYSFDTDPYLYVTKDFEKFIKYKANSRYVESLKTFPRNVSMRDMFKYGVINPAYTRILYDKYRNVYYRLVYPGGEINENDNLRGLFFFKSTFSIIILDENFNTIGETLLPENNFYDKDIFIAKDGLYISENHPENPTYNPDYFSFRLLKLTKDEK